MKKSLLLLLFGGAGFAQVNIPDTNFKNLLLNSNTTTNLVALDEEEEYIAVDANGNGIIEATEAQAVYFLNIDGENIASLTGIEHFTSLIYLNAMQNNLTTVDLTALENLETLRLGSCGITSLNVAGLTKLEGMDLFGNDLTTLDVSTLVNLEVLDTFENFNLSSINFGGIDKIHTLLIGNNPITELDVSGFSQLTQFECSDTNVTTLDVSNNLAITYMVITENEDLLSINLTNNTAATYFLSNNTNLNSVCVSASRVAEFETYFEGQGQDVEVTTECDNTPVGINIPDDNFRNLLLDSNTTTVMVAMGENEEFIAVDANSNGVIEEDEAEAVYALSIENKDIGSLTGIEHFINLKSLNALLNDIDEADLSALTELEIAYLSSCGLTSVNVNGLDKLNMLDLSNNSLTALDVSTLVNLRNLAVNENFDLSTLTFGDIENIKVLSLGNNPVTALDLSGFPLLERLECIVTNIEVLDLGNNPELNYLIVTDNPDLESINLKNTNPPVYVFTGNASLESVCADEEMVAELEDYFDGIGVDVSVSSECFAGTGDHSLGNLKVYPNPSTGVVNFEGNIAIESVSVYTIDGRLVEEKIINANNAVLDISALPSAAYLVRVRTEKGFESVRLIKQ